MWVGMPLGLRHETRGQINYLRLQPRAESAAGPGSTAPAGGQLRELEYAGQSAASSAFIAHANLPLSLWNDVRLDQYFARTFAIGAGLGVQADDRAVHSRGQGQQDCGVAAPAE